jgi:hypothetical protein
MRSPLIVITEAVRGCDDSAPAIANAVMLALRSEGWHLLAHPTMEQSKESKLFAQRLLVHGELDGDWLIDASQLINDRMLSEAHNADALLQDAWDYVWKRWGVELARKLSGRAL